MPAPRRAVVVGVDEYQDKKIPPLKGATNDATEVRDKLKAFGDFEIREEHFLVNNRATGTAVRKGLSDLLWKTEPSSLSLFYFSGHGFQDDYGNGYLATHDVNSREPFIAGIRMQELNELVLASKHKEAVVVILDCCYSGIAAEPNKDASAKPPELKQWFSALEKTQGKGKIILASSGKDEKSREIRCVHQIGNVPEHDHGAFTFHLLEGLDGKAGDNGRITLQGIITYLEDQLASHVQPSCLGAGVSQAKSIIISRATQWADINLWLDEVTRHLRVDEPISVFNAVRSLHKVSEKCPQHDKLTEFRQRIDAKLEKYKGPATQWHLAHQGDEKLQASRSFDQLRLLMPRLSCVTIWQQSVIIQTLLRRLCEVSSKRHGTSESEEAFINELCIQEHTERRSKVQTTKVATAPPPNRDRKT